MTSIQGDLKQPQLLAIPDEPRLLNHRALLCGTLVSGQRVIPKAGMMGFLKYVMADISLHIETDRLVLHQQLHNNLSLVPTAIDVFVDQYDYNQDVLLGSHPGPIYRTLLHVVTPDLTCYLHIPSAVAGQYLLLHPGSLPVHDLFGLTDLPHTDSDYALNDAINAIGFKPWIQGTGLEFLAESANVAGHYHAND